MKIGANAKFIRARERQMAGFNLLYIALTFYATAVVDLSPRIW
jgi:hypothetical protein